MEFTTQTAEDRGLPIETVREIAKGRVYSGEMALEIGLVDELGTLQDAIDYAGSVAELEDFKVEHVIPPTPKPVSLNWTDFIKSFFEKETGFNLDSRNMYDNIRIYCLECEAID